MEPLPALQLPQDYRAQPLFFKTVPDVNLDAREPEKRRHSIARSSPERSAATPASQSVDAQSSSRLHSATQTSRSASRHLRDAPLTYRSTRASVLRHKKTIENEIEALLKSELELQRERDGAEAFTRPVNVSADCPPTRSTRAATLRAEHARHASEKHEAVDTSTPRTPRVRSASLKSRPDPAQPTVAVRTTRAADLRQSLNAQRLRELELARAKLQDEEALIEQGRGEMLRERRRASQPGTAVAADTTTPVVKSTRAAALLRERVEAKMQVLERLEALEAAAQEALLHPPNRPASSSNGRGQPLTPRSTKSSLLRGRTAAAHMHTSAADGAATTPTRRRRHHLSSTSPSRRGNASTSAGSVEDKGNANDSVLPAAAGVIDPFTSAASVSGFVVHHPSEPALRSVSDMGDPAALLTSAILHIDRVGSDDEDGATEVASELAAAESDVIVVSPFDEPPPLSVKDALFEVPAEPQPLLETEDEEVRAEAYTNERNRNEDASHLREPVHDVLPLSPTLAGVENGRAAKVEVKPEGIAAPALAGGHSLCAAPSENAQETAHSPFIESSATSSASNTIDVKELLDDAETAHREECSQSSPRPSCGSSRGTHSSRASEECADAAHSCDRAVLSAHDSFQVDDVNAISTSLARSVDGTCSVEEESPPSAPQSAEAVRPAPANSHSDKDVEQLPVHPHTDTDPFPAGSRRPSSSSRPAPSLRIVEEKAVDEGQSPLPTEPSLVRVDQVAPKATPLITGSAARTRPPLEREQQAETLQTLHRVRAAKGEGQMPPLQPFSQVTQPPQQGGGVLPVARATLPSADLTDARIADARDGAKETPASRSSSVESIPTFVAGSAAASARGKASPSFQWSRRPAPPTAAVVSAGWGSVGGASTSADTTPPGAGHAQTSMSFVDFSAVSASPGMSSPSPASIRQLRLNNARVLFRRYFSKWMSLWEHKKQHTKAAVRALPTPRPRPPFTTAPSVPRQERSPTAPPHHPDINNNSGDHNNDRISGLRVPQIDRVPREAAQVAAVVVEPTQPPLPVSSTSGMMTTPEVQPLEPMQSRPPAASRRPSHPLAAAMATPLPSSLSQHSLSAQPLVVVSPKAKRSDGRGDSHATFPGHRDGSQPQRSRSKGLRVPRLQESFASLPRGVAAGSTTSRPSADDTWQALEASPISALSSALQHITMPSSSDTPRGDHALPSPIRRVERAGATPPQPLSQLLEDWSSARGAGKGHTPVILRIPAIAPDTWAVAPPAPMDMSAQQCLSPSNRRHDTAVSRQSTEPSPAPVDSRGASCLSETVEARLVPSRHRSATLVDSARETAERSPCDITLDNLLQLSHNGDDVLGGGTPSSDLATGGAQEPWRHAPTPLLSTLEAPPQPTPAAAHTSDVECSPRQPPRSGNVFRRQDSSASYGAAPCRLPVLEDEEDVENGSDEKAETDEETAVDTQAQEDESLRHRYLRDGSGDFSSSGAASHDPKDELRQAASEEAAVAEEEEEPEDGEGETEVGQREGEAKPDAPVVTQVAELAPLHRGSSADPQDNRGQSDPPAPSVVSTYENAPAHPDAPELLITSGSPVADLYCPPSHMPSVMGSVGRAETCYMSASDLSPHDGRWATHSTEGSPNPLSTVETELQGDLDNPYPEEALRYVKYVHRDM